MNRKKLTLGLFGFGCVGQGLHDVLEETPTLKTQIKKICVKDRNKKRSLPASRFTFDKNDILNDEEINVVVELIDDADAAFEIVSAALSKGKAVVTANKKMIAEHFSELLALQEKYDVPLLYEAACCASIPIIRNLEEYYDNDLLQSLEGIVNGSTNYILTKTSAEHISYAEALKDAQEKGYAETNPLLDTGGFDAKFKLLILIAHAFGLVLKPEELYNSGIDKLGDLELAYAREKGFKIKLVAHAGKSANGKIEALVLPKFVNAADKLFSVDDVFNGVKIQSCFSDTQFFSGRGAGGHPTASAVLSDISALTYDYRYEYKKLKGKEKQESDDEIYLRILLRHTADDAQKVKSSFLRVEETLLNRSEGYTIGVLSLKQLKKLNTEKNSVVLIDFIDEQEINMSKQEAENSYEFCDY
jgi:homoserine dehydrogenase